MSLQPWLPPLTCPFVGCGHPLAYDGGRIQPGPSWELPRELAYDNSP